MKLNNDNGSDDSSDYQGQNFHTHMFVQTSIPFAPCVQRARTTKLAQTFVIINFVWLYSTANTHSYL